MPRVNLRAIQPAAAAAAACLLLASGCNGGDGGGTRPAASDPGPVHVHGLGINPKDGALYIATHTGLFRAGPGETKAARVGGRYQDTMGFTVAGPDRFLGSGHPDPRDQLPPFLGLIESTDAGRSWRPVSKQGESDFHVLEADGGRVYGFGSDYETRAPQFLASADNGRTWQERAVPEPLLSLALAPGDPDRLVASGERALYGSTDGGRRWKRLADAAGAVAWPAESSLYLIGGDGSVQLSADGGRRWEPVGQIGGQPAAFEAGAADDLYAALHDGTVKRSTDGGRSWRVRSAPSSATGAQP